MDVRADCRLMTAFRFPLLGEPLALDLVNTRMRHHGVDLDLLDTPARLAAWLRAERQHVRWTGPVSHADLAAVRTLRDAIGDVLYAVRAHSRPPATALRTLNGALANAPQQWRLAWTPQGPRVAETSRRSRRDVLLHALAEDAIEVATGPNAARLRKCAHPDCVLQFIAHNPRRRWCSSATCGNRARVAQHYLRQQGTR